MPETSKNQERKRSVPFYAWYVLFVLLVVYILNFIDRQILSILAEDIKADLSLSDAQLGFLYGTAFAIFYALFGIPLGRLADKWRRVTLIAIGLALWSSMTALSGFATTFAMLAIARMGVGIGEATAAPASYSLISGHFPPERRATALSIYASGLYIGFGLSLPLGGFVLGRWTSAFPDAAIAPLGLSGWQAAFLIVGLPGLLVALWVLTLKEPKTSGAAAQAGKPSAWREFSGELFAILPPLTLFSVSRYPGELRRNLLAFAFIAATAFGLSYFFGDTVQWTAYGLGAYAVFSWVQYLKQKDRPTYQLIWATPTVIGLAFAYGTIAFIIYAVTFWAPPHLLRTMYDGPQSAALFLNGMTAAEEVAVIYGASSALSSAIGVVIGGIFADWLKTRYAAGRIYLTMGASLLSAPLIFIMFGTDDALLFYCITPFALLISSSWSGAAIASLQDVVLPRMRATAGATFILGMTMIGLALGPYIAGKIATVTGELRLGIYGLYLVLPLTMFLLWKATKKIAEVEETIGSRAAEAGEII